MGGAPAYAAAGLLAGVVFGGAALMVVAQSAPAPLPPAALMVRGVNGLFAMKRGSVCCRR
jgi:hypothetical protein